MLKGKCICFDDFFIPVSWLFLKRRSEFYKILTDIIEKDKNSFQKL